MKQDQDVIDKQRTEVEEHQKELVRMRKEIVEQQRDEIDTEIEIKEKLNILSVGDELYGLTRSALLSKTWHKNYPKAAKNCYFRHGRSLCALCMPCLVFFLQLKLL